MSDGVAAATKPIDFGSVPAVGATTQEKAAATLTMHGVTQTVSFSTSVERASAGLDVLADAPVTFNTWNIANPSVGGIVTIANHGILEVLQVPTKGTGNPVSTADLRRRILEDPRSLFPRPRCRRLTSTPRTEAVYVP